ncbi:MAG: hypothetical protein AAFS10_12375, partial [Myxococcota bacterium]
MRSMWPSGDTSLIKERTTMTTRQDPPLEGRFAEVQQMFSSIMRSAGYTSAQLSNAVRLWRDFVLNNHAPRFNKPAVFAAAVEYAIARMDFIDDVTQSDAAERYGVSVASISKNFKLLSQALNLEVFDPRYSTRPHPLESLSIGPDGVLSPGAFLDMMSAVSVHPDTHTIAPLLLDPDVIEQLKALPQKDPAWFGGRRSIQAFIAQQSPIRPDCVVWGAESGLLGQEILMPTEGDDAVLESLITTFFEPIQGAPRRPISLHLEDERLAQRLRSLMEDLNIELCVHPLPILDELFEHMDDFLQHEMDQPSDIPEDYLCQGRAAPNTVHGFFEAAAELAHQAPWKTFNDDLF